MQSDSLVLNAILNTLLRPFIESLLCKSDSNLMKMAYRPLSAEQEHQGKVEICSISKHNASLPQACL